MEGVQWSDEAAQHMVERHGVTVIEASDAMADPDAIWADPDPASTSGRSVRIVGWCHVSRRLITVIVLRGETEWIGVNGWPTKSGRDRAAYREANR